jgi:hypothetical protein
MQLPESVDRRRLVGRLNQLGQRARLGDGPSLGPFEGPAHPAPESDHAGEMAAVRRTGAADE